MRLRGDLLRTALALWRNVLIVFLIGLFFFAIGPVAVAAVTEVEARQTVAAGQLDAAVARHIASSYVAFTAL